MGPGVPEVFQCRQKSDKTAEDLVDSNTMDACHVDPLRADRQDRLFRYSLCLVFSLTAALVCLIASFVTSWGHINLYNGNPIDDLLNARFLLYIGETAAQQISGSYPSSLRRFDDTWFSEASCGGNGRFSDLCKCIVIKQGTNKLMVVTLVIIMACVALSLVYFAWVAQHARFGTLPASKEPIANVGSHGCRVTEDGLAWSWSEWARDPCAAAVLMWVALWWGVIFGLIAWPIGSELFRQKLLAGLANISPMCVAGRNPARPHAHARFYF